MRMGWRTLLVRTPVVLALVLIVLLAVLYQWWTNPRAVRQMLLEGLSERFPGSSVRVESAQLRLLGGVSFHDLRLARRDGLDASDFLYVPSGIIYHDKERLLDGRFSIRKLELNRPRLRLIRERDGSCNLQALGGPIDLHERLPTIVLHQATVQIEDQGAAPGVPLLELRDLDITIVNDPLPTVIVEGKGTSDVAGPLHFKITADRVAESLELAVQLKAIPMSSELIRRVALLAPASEEHLRGVRGTAGLEAEVHVDPRAATTVGFDLRGRLDHGEIVHRRLPLPLEKAFVTFTATNRIVPESTWPRSPLGVYVPAFHLEAQTGPTRMQLDVVGIAIPDKCEALDSHELCAAIDGKIENLEVTEKVTAALPEQVQEVEPNFQPRGPVNVTHTFRRVNDSAWNSRWLLDLAGISVRYHEMPYRIRAVRGTIDRVNSQAGHPVLSVDLSGRMAGAAVRLTGGMAGPTPSAIDFRFGGDNLTVEEELIEALPPETRARARQFHPAGRFGLDVRIRRKPGSAVYDNGYLLLFRDGSFHYDQFPYTLHQVTGELEVWTNGKGKSRWETRQLRGRHQGAVIQLEARNVAAGERLDQWSWSKIQTPAHPSTAMAPTRTVDAVQVRMRGTAVPVDRELEESLAPESIPGRRTLLKSWQTLNPTGTLNFAAEVVDLPELPNAVSVGLALSGCCIRPHFFELPLEQLKATVQYSQGQVHLHDIEAQQTAAGGEPPGRLQIPEGVVYCKPDGGFQVRLNRLHVRDMPTHSKDDAEPGFIQALPPSLRRIVETIQLRGVFNLTTALVIETREGGAPPAVWWDGGMGLSNGQVNLGVEVTGITGQVSCTGQHNGQTLEVAFGNVLLDQGTILKQPFRHLQGVFEVPRDQHDRVQIRNLKASLFGGVMAGEGYLRFAPNFHYDFMLKALQLDLEAFGRHNFPAAGAELQGQATAALHLVGDGVNLSDLRGNGRIDIPNGRLYRLPWMLDLLKTISLRVPDQVAFTEARMTFALEGPRMVVEELKLVGNPVSLRGEGTVNLDGSNLTLDFFVDWGKILPPGFQDLTRWFGDQLFKIKARGSVGEVRYEKELIPSMMAPLKQVITGK